MIAEPTLKDINWIFHVLWQLSGKYRHNQRLLAACGIIAVRHLRAMESFRKIVHGSKAGITKDTFVKALMRLDLPITTNELREMVELWRPASDAAAITTNDFQDFLKKITTLSQQSLQRPPVPKMPEFLLLKDGEPLAWYYYSDKHGCVMTHKKQHLHLVDAEDAFLKAVDDDIAQRAQKVTTYSGVAKDPRLMYWMTVYRRVDNEQGVLVDFKMEHLQPDAFSDLVRRVGPFVWRIATL
jgi:hypothetical protein